jgi:hypothetical protein
MPLLAALEGLRFECQDPRIASVRPLLPNRFEVVGVATPLSDLMPAQRVRVRVHGDGSMRVMARSPVPEPRPKGCTCEGAPR